MAATEVKVQMQQRRDTAAAWTSANPTLLNGELGFETDTKKIKIGDGSTAWNSLAYIPGFSISGYPLATSDIADDAITGDKLAHTSVTAGSYTAADITVDAQGRITAAASGTIGTSEIANDAVTADKLADTSVSAGSYTLASITVDAQGRLTAASSGTAADTDKITEGNTEAEVVDTGSDGHFKVTTEGTERVRVGPAGQVGIAGANYGTSGQVLTSGGASGAVSWADASGAKILQVVQTTKTDGFSTSSTSYVDVTGMSAAITPNSSSNKVLVRVAVLIGTGQTASENKVRVLRGSTNILTSDYIVRSDESTSAAKEFTIEVLDSPSTTSATTYKLQGLAQTNEVFVNRNGSATVLGQSTITLMEVAA